MKTYFFLINEDIFLSSCSPCAAMDAMVKLLRFLTSFGEAPLSELLLAFLVFPWFTHIQ